MPQGADTAALERARGVADMHAMPPLALALQPPPSTSCSVLALPWQPRVFWEARGQGVPRARAPLHREGCEGGGARQRVALAGAPAKGMPLCIPRVPRCIACKLRKKRAFVSASWEAQRRPAAASGSASSSTHKPDNATARRGGPKRHHGDRTDVSSGVFPEGRLAC